MNFVNEKTQAWSDEPTLAEKFARFVKADYFPCLGAKSALARGQIDVCSAGDIRSSWDDLRVADALFNFAQRYGREPTLFRSFAVVYAEPERLTEDEFERFLWQRLQSFSDKDSMFGACHDGRVASDPGDREFSMSFGGQAFFVVGLHPGASRPARRFAHPALIFNAHDQFEELRRQNRYERLRQTILARDLMLAGTANPMLARHGEASEARQYSGRVVGSDWKCPFERKDFDWKTSLSDAEMGSWPKIESKDG